MKNQIIIFAVALIIGIAGTTFVTADADSPEMIKNQDGLSLITETPEEGFQVALTLSRKGVTSVQSDKEVLFSLRDVYSKDPDALIASSQVVAINFQTVAAANNYWRD